MLFVALLLLIIFGICAAFIRVPILHTVYALCGVRAPRPPPRRRPAARPLTLVCAQALLFSFYIIYDTQRMMYGKKKYTLR